MIITNEAYHNLIQVQCEARDRNNDHTYTNKDWYLKISTKLGTLATGINDNTHLTT